MPREITFKELQSGELNAVLILEIISIPDKNVIGCSLIEEAEAKNKENIGNLLSEIYQTYKTNITGNNLCDISIEVLWLTEKEENQPYKAKIRLFLIIRYIGKDNIEVSNSINGVGKLCADYLQNMKYGFKEVECEEFIHEFEKIDDSKIRTIVKGESLNNLQNQFLPVCYSYDIIPENNADLGCITNSLINYPNCAVSIQLMSTYFFEEEIQIINQTTQMLDTLQKGIGIDSSNFITDPLAEKYAQRYKYYEQNKAGNLFSFNILVYGSGEAVDNVSTKIYGHLNSNAKNSIDIKFIDLKMNDVNRISNFYPLPWAVNEKLITQNRDQTVWNSEFVGQSQYRLPYIITAEEAVNFFRLPIGNENVGAGLPIDESKKKSKSYSDNIINSGDILIGKLKSEVDSEIGISLNDLTKHMLVVGTPGCGKTTFSMSLLDRLWKDYNIPFIVIEPAKNEYRAMLQSIPELQIFTPGKNFISPFVFNPFLPPKNVKLETYKSTLKTAFSAAVSMTTPLDKIFEDAINNCYSDFRWLDTYTKDDDGRVFNISDFIKCFQKTFDNIGYTGDAKNIGRAGTVRLKSLVNIFDNYNSIPIEHLLSKPTVIELSAIENSDEKTLIISLLLLSILAYINANYIGKGQLKNVILLEEAHVLFDAANSNMPGEADPSRIAQQLIKRMLAEARAYGVSIIVADQSPRKVTSDVVALTDIKVGFRLVESADKDILSDSTGMDEIQKKRLSRLKPGEAFLFFNKLEEPEEIKIEDYREKNNIEITISDEQVHELSTYWTNKPEELRPYPECNCTPYCQKECDYNRRVLAKDIARRIFVKNFNAEVNAFDVVKTVLGQISSLIKDELNSEPFNRELLSCVKVHLWRKIKYDTKIPVNNKLIINSLKKK